MLDDVPHTNTQVVIRVSPPEQRSEIGGVNKYFTYTISGKDAKGTLFSTQVSLKSSVATPTSSSYARY